MLLCLLLRLLLLVLLLCRGGCCHSLQQRWAACWTHNTWTHTHGVRHTNAHTHTQRATRTELVGVATQLRTSPLSLLMPIASFIHHHRDTASSGQHSSTQPTTRKAHLASSRQGDAGLRGGQTGLVRRQTLAHARLAQTGNRPHPSARPHARGGDPQTGPLSLVGLLAAGVIYVCCCCCAVVLW